MFPFVAAVLFAIAAPAPETAARQLSLQDAVRLGVARNPDLRKQALLALSAEQDRVLARSSVLPQVDFNGSLSRTRSAGPFFVGTTVVNTVQSTSFSNGWQAGVKVTQLVFDGGKWWNGIEASNLAQASAQAQVEEQTLQITYLVEQRFYEVVRAQRQLLVLTDASRRSRDQADFVQRLFEGGRSTQADVYAARANRDNDEIQRLQAERGATLARADLSVAVGLDPAESFGIIEPAELQAEPSAPPADPEAVQRALSSRPSLKAAAFTVQANAKSATAARGDYWPTVSLVGSYNRNTSDLSQFTSSPELNSQLSGGVYLKWNLFNGLNTHANVEKAEIQTLLSQNDLENARRTVASDVEKAIAQLSTARAQARVATETETNSRENLRLAKARQEVGLGTQLEVRDAELKLTQAQLSRLGALVDGREAEAALRRAVGG